MVQAVDTVAPGRPGLPASNRLWRKSTTVCSGTRRTFPIFRSTVVAANDADGAGFLAHFLGQILALGQVDGVQHGLPFTLAGTYLLCNDDLFQQAGVTRMPRTWDDVRDVARVLTNKTGVAGLSLP